MAALDVAKGGCPDDADGGEATCWRPAEPSTRWSFADSCSAGGSSGMARLEAASSTLELRIDISAVATSPWDLLATVASAWWLSSCSAIRPPTCASGPAPAVWATQVTYLVHDGCLTAAISASECHPAIRTIPSEGGALHRKGDRDVGPKAFFLRSLVL